MTKSVAGSSRVRSSATTRIRDLKRGTRWRARPVCLETPQGKQIGSAGGPPVIVPGGIPMHLTAIGAEQRRSLVLILHESSKPSMSMTHDWAPTALYLQ